MQDNGGGGGGGGGGYAQSPGLSQRMTGDGGDIDDRQGLGPAPGHGPGQGLGLDYINREQILTLQQPTVTATVSILPSSDLEAMGLLRYLQVPPVSPTRSTLGKSSPTSRHHNYGGNIGGGLGGIGGGGYGNGGGGGGGGGGGSLSIASPVQSLYATSSLVLVTIRDNAKTSHDTGESRKGKERGEERRGRGYQHALVTTRLTSIITTSFHDTTTYPPKTPYQHFLSTQTLNSLSYSLTLPSHTLSYTHTPPTPPPPPPTNRHPHRHHHRWLL